MDIDLSVSSRTTGRELRRSRYTMLTRRGGRTLILMQQKNHNAPATLLIADDTYRLLLPQAQRPVELPLGLVTAGDLSQAGFLRLNLYTRYEVRQDFEETLGDIPCRRLELLPKDPSIPIGRVRYWIAHSGSLPLKIEFHSRSGEVLKTVRFTGYQETGAGLRPARIEIEDTGRPDERTTLTLGKPSGVHTSNLAFDLDDLMALREEAAKLIARGQETPNGRLLVEALASRRD